MQRYSKKHSLSNSVNYETSYCSEQRMKNEERRVKRWISYNQAGCRKIQDDETRNQLQYY